MFRKITAFLSWILRGLPMPLQILCARVFQLCLRFLKKVRRWLLTGIVILFFIGLLWQLFQITKGGVLSSWDAAFSAFGIALYTDKIPFVAGFATTVLLAIILGALLDWRPSKKLLSSIPVIGNLFGLTVSVIESVGDLKGMPAVLIESYNGLRQLAFVSGFEPIRRWRLSDENEAPKRPWQLFGVSLGLVRDKKPRGLRLRVYYPDFPFIINGRGGWAAPRRIEWLLNPFEEIFARLASAGFATRFKAGEPIALTDEEWSSLGLDVVVITEDQMIRIVKSIKK